MTFLKIDDGRRVGLIDRNGVVLSGAAQHVALCKCPEPSICENCLRQAFHDGDVRWFAEDGSDVQTDNQGNVIPLSR